LRQVLTDSARNTRAITTGPHQRRKYLFRLEAGWFSPADGISPEGSEDSGSDWLEA